MCDLAWITLCERVRAQALASRTAYLLAGEDPPDPDALIADLADAVTRDPGDSTTPELRELRALLRV